MGGNAGNVKVDFDEYADEYEKLLKDQLGFFSAQRDYFSAYKIGILRQLFPEGFGRILDFGAGIGLSLPHVLREFPAAEVFASDISKASLAHIERSFPAVHAVEDEALDDLRFDLILVITVMHHIAPDLRGGVMRRLEKLLNPGGRVCIFEHNPFNPVTRRMVATCPFDEDAVLLTRGEARDLIRATPPLRVEQQGYCLFFPESLKALRPIETALEWLPLGGQYYIVAQKA